MIEITCSHCGYAWEYTGKDRYATCPECDGSNTLDPVQFDMHMKEERKRIVAQMHEAEQAKFEWHQLNGGESE